MSLLFLKNEKNISKSASKMHYTQLSLRDFNSRRPLTKNRSIPTPLAINFRAANAIPSTVAHNRCPRGLRVSQRESLPRLDINSNQFFISCKESRIESNTSFYGCFYLGPFDESLSQTLANDLRRTLLSELNGLAITSVEIEGVLHKFSSLPGIKEPVLDLICNLQTVVLKKSTFGKALAELTLKQNSANNEKKLTTSKRITKKTYTGFLKVRGPRVIKAADLKLPAGIQCVDPNQYIATLAEDGILNLKITINEGKNYVFQKQQNLEVNSLKKRNIMLYKTKKTSNIGGVALASLTLPSNVSELKMSTDLKSNKELNKYEDNLHGAEPISLDAVFMPVTKVNCIIEDNNLSTDVNFFKKFSGALTNVTLGNTEYYPRRFSAAKAQEFKPTTRDVSSNTMTLQPRIPSLFFKNALILQKNNLKLDKLYTKLEKQSKLKLIPWSQDLLYFNLLNNVSNNNMKTGNLNTFLASSATNVSKLRLGKNTFMQQQTSNLGLFLWNKFDQKSALALPNVAKRLLYPNHQYVTFEQMVKPIVLTQIHKNKNLLQLNNELTNFNYLTISPNEINPTAMNPSDFKTSLYKLQKETYNNSFNSPSYGLLLNHEYSNLLKLKPLSKKSHLIVEIWTNGSIHPRQALFSSFTFLSNTFLKLKKVKMLGSMFKSELAYSNINKYFTNSNIRSASIGESRPFTNESTSLNLALLKDKQETEFIFYKRGTESLDAPVGVLPISLRAYTALRKAKIFTLGDLIGQSKDDLLKLKNFGPKSLYEIEKHLGDLGLTLKNN